MDVEFVEARTIQQRLHGYMEDYDEFHWAVAWGTHVGLANQLFAQKAKFRNVTFGVAFSQTDPSIVDALVGVTNGYVATKFAGAPIIPRYMAFEKVGALQQSSVAPISLAAVLEQISRQPWC